MTSINCSKQTKYNSIFKSQYLLSILNISPSFHISLNVIQLEQLNGMIK